MLNRAASRPLRFMLAAGFLAAVLLAGALAWRGGGDAAPDREIEAALRRLPFCAVASRSGVPAETIAGVMLAEKLLNRDWTDMVQDTGFAVLAWLRGEAWWRGWVERSAAIADRALAERSRSADWSRDVAWTGFAFSLGPAQITTRTALRACASAQRPPDWCAEPRSVVQTLLSETGSLEAAALVLDEERRSHLRETGVDVGGDPGRWATLYNFGGDLFRARFRDRPDREPNAFGRWAERHAEGFRTALACR